jgi:hypothetical protein
MPIDSKPGASPLMRRFRRFGVIQAHRLVLRFWVGSLTFSITPDMIYG